MTEKGAGYALVYDEAVRAISDQQTALGTLYSRAGLVGSAAAVVASLAAERIVKDHSAGTWLKLGFLCYLGVALLAGYVLWPRRKWRFHFEAGRLQWLYLEGPDPLPVALLKRDLALHIDGYVQHNGHLIDRMSWALAAAIAALLLGLPASSMMCGGDHGRKTGRDRTSGVVARAAAGARCSPTTGPRLARNLWWHVG
jgi:hypothetical protein